MALNANDANLDNLDPELKEFLVNEQIKTQIQAQIRKLNSLCFEKCVEKPGLDDDQTFLLIRLPKETVERSRDSQNTKVGSVIVYEDDTIEFQDDKTGKIFDLMRNTPTKREVGGRKQREHVVANEESDLLKISLQKDEAIHLGKVRLSTLLAVPKVDEKDVSTVFG